jgi:hypothetical protein
MLTCNNTSNVLQDGPKPTLQLQTDIVKTHKATTWRLIQDTLVRHKTLCFFILCTWFHVITAFCIFTIFKLSSGFWPTVFVLYSEDLHFIIVMGSS